MAEGSRGDWDPFSILQGAGAGGGPWRTNWIMFQTRASIDLDRAIMEDSGALIDDTVMGWGFQGI
ncbi:MAG: hypothetical protein Q9226_006468 [Calogaya cf. arnoldii]